MAVRPGAGLTNMRDRLAAVGGAVEIRSAPGCGTVVSGSVPLEGASVPARPT
jgi:signal transduction histidine kinase